jgi:hypothetical protein
MASADAEMMDADFGVPRGPDSIYPWEANRLPRSLSKLCSNLGKKLLQSVDLANVELFRFSSRAITYIWAMDALGEIFIAVEELAELPDGRNLTGHPRRRDYPQHPAEEKKLGHPTLLAGGHARMAGELFMDSDIDGVMKWYINDNSGRYCKRVPPTKSNKDNILNKFRELIGNSVVFDQLWTS